MSGPRDDEGLIDVETAVHLVNDREPPAPGEPIEWDLQAVVRLWVAGKAGPKPDGHLTRPPKGGAVVFIDGGTPLLATRCEPAAIPGQTVPAYFEETLRAHCENNGLRPGKLFPKENKTGRQGEQIAIIEKIAKSLGIDPINPGYGNRKRLKNECLSVEPELFTDDSFEHALRALRNSPATN